MSARKQLFLLHSLTPERSLDFDTLRKRTIFFQMCVTSQVYKLKSFETLNLNQFPQRSICSDSFLELQTHRHASSNIIGCQKEINF